jgi:hypothetical protein
MKRTVYVARTSHDLQHVNRLVTPEYGIVSLNVVAAGGLSSKCYLPPDAPAAPAGGDDKFHFVPEYETVEIRYEIKDKFALITGAKLEVFSRFDATPLWSVDLTPLGVDWWSHGKHVIKWDGRLIQAPTAEQKGTDGGGKGMTHDFTTLALDKTRDPFPDGYFTLEFPPYKLKLTVTGDQQARANPVAAWTYWHILIKSIELEVGDEENIPAILVDDDRHKMDKNVRKRLIAKGGIPATGGSVEVVLLSNVFKTSLAQMNTNVGFTKYQDLWGKGPQIPLNAKIRLADSADAEVKIDETPKGAVALGKAKFLWDWEDPDELVDAQQPGAPTPAAFIKDAINYYKDGTDATRSGSDHKYPKGDNCHVDRGGERGPGADLVFQAHDGYAPADTLTAGKFPFKVVGCTQERFWASLSQGWTKGKLKGKTGVIFQPTRMGGDDYIITVYLAYDRTAKDKLALDVKTEPLVAPDQIKSKATGKFQIWREVHIARHITKLSTLAGLLPAKLAGVQANFQKPYVHLEDKMGADNAYALTDHKLANGSAPNYNALLRARLTGTGNGLFTQNLATDAAADHASVDSMVLARSYGDFVKATHLALNPGVSAASGDIAALATEQGNSEDTMAQALGPWNHASALAANVVARLVATSTWLVNNGVDTDIKYGKLLDDLLFNVGEPFAGDLQLVSGGKNGATAPPGVTTLEFRFTNTVLRDQFAGGRPVAYWYGSAIDPSDAKPDRCVIMFWLARVDYFSHEFGHHFFLPHAKYPTASPPGGHQDNRHDDVDSGCLMTYSQVRPAFCGLCQLRIRGWSADGAGALDKVSANNKKP